MSIPVALGRREKPAAGRRAALIALFVVYLVLLVWAVLWKFGAPTLTGEGVRAIKLVPFVPGGGYGASRPAEMVANVALFVPFGVYLGMLAPPSWRRWTVVVLAALASLALEVTQYVLAVGSSDVSDVILNTTGALIGVGLLALVRWRLRERAARAVVWVCSVATVLALVATAALVVSPLRLDPPPREGLGHLQRTP